MTVSTAYWCHGLPVCARGDPVHGSHTQYICWRKPTLLLGGPIFQLFRRSHLVGDSLEFLYRRLLVITLVAWLPLLLLTIFDTS
ncbi:MAG TPA: hypothetical protein VMH03_15945, partial [Terriglobales bacterium]|nr:hypothetical protein [Terriglobales bacterium]